jgi:hypothetical protein
MAVMQLNTPIYTRTPQLTVENPLAVGRYVFRLQVRDDDGHLSGPVEVSVSVVERTFLGTLATTFSSLLQ